MEDIRLGERLTICQIRKGNNLLFSNIAIGTRRRMNYLVHSKICLMHHILQASILENLTDQLYRNLNEEH